jgi:hypothetical protein
MPDIIKTLEEAIEKAKTSIEKLKKVKIEEQGEAGEETETPEETE